MSFGSEIKSGNITENWLFELSYNSGTLRLAYTDYEDGSGNFYYGVVLNKPTIRESIDLLNSTAKSGNLTLKIAEFNYRGNPISEFIFGGSQYFINRDMVVKSIVNGGSSVTLAKYRISDLETDGQNISISCTSHRPWAGVSFPQNQHLKYNVYEPVVYGDYTPASNANTTSRVTSARMVFPVPALYTSSNSIYTVCPRSYTASDNAFIHLYTGFDQFLPLRLAEGAFTNSSPNNRVDSVTSTTIDNSGLNILQSRFSARVSGTLYGSLFEGYLFTEPSARNTDIQSNVTVFSDQHKMFIVDKQNSIDTTSFAKVDFDNSSGESHYGLVLTAKKIFHTQFVDGVRFTISVIDDDGSSVSNAQNVNHQFFAHQFDSSSDRLINSSSGIERAYSGTITAGSGDYSTGTGIIEFNDTPSNSIAGLSNSLINPDELLFKITSIPSEVREDIEMRIHSMQLYHLFAIPVFSGSGSSLSAEELAIEKDIEKLSEIEYFYIGANGLTKNGYESSADIDEIHDAHRDLLIRFTGMTTSTPINWSSGLNINGTKDWKIRYWELEPVSLEDKLNKLQYEGGFIFLFENGDITKPKYIYIKDSYSSTDYTITKNDISEISIKPTNIDSVVTKMDINYQKHPVPNSGYYFNEKPTNSTTRSNFNIQTEENILQVNLDAYCFPEIPTSPSSNPNDDFYTYYDNINGDVKVLVSGSIINPALYNINLGDTVQFSDMYPEKAFGKSFANVVFMITTLQRTAGSLKFEAREISTTS